MEKGRDRALFFWESLDGMIFCFKKVVSLYEQLVTIDFSNIKKMEKKKILKGKSDFKYVVSNNGYFVDKTLLIKDFYENGDFVLLMPRPRRFGKTMNLSMIEHFFDINKKGSTSLFKNFKIAQEKTFCEKHQNKYPVINISLKSVRGEDWETCLKRFKQIISEAYSSHRYLLESDKLFKYEKKRFEQILLKQADIVDDQFSLFQLSKHLKTHFGIPPFLLIDEYDTPVIDGYNNNYYKKVIDFMRVFMGEAFKENSYANKGLITGIMRVARESIFSEMNNVGVYSITSLFFMDKFGFTEEETLEILEYYDLQSHFQEIKEWYDGYKFGKVDNIYNPWSIMNYALRHEEGFKPWWANTGTDSLIKNKIVQPDIENTHNTLQQLITGQTIDRDIYETFVFPDFDKQRELLWTLLAYSGYLTHTEKVKGKVYRYLLKIPNKEVQMIFRDIVITWLEVDYKIARRRLEKTVEHLVNNRLEKFETGLKKVMNDTISYWDTVGEPERVYQAYILGLLAIIGDDYVVRSNRESGKGRYDIMMMPHDKTRFGVVLEIKQINRNKTEEDKDFHKRINTSIAEATEQIEKKKYYQELVAHKINKIIKLPLVFAEKEPYVFPIKIS